MEVPVFVRQRQGERELRGLGGRGLQVLWVSPWGGAWIAGQETRGLQEQGLCGLAEFPAALF
jgi:hypothetical protein